MDIPYLLRYLLRKLIRMKRINIIIVDDQKLFAHSIKVVLDSNPEINGFITVVNTGAEAIEEIKQKQYDVAIVDVWMPELDGITTTQEIRKLDDKIKIIMLSSYGYDKYVKAAFRNGANAYLLKDISPKDLLNAIIKVYNGNKVISKEISDYLEGKNHDISPNFGYPSVVDSLSKREKEILVSIGKGLSNDEIAQSLYISEHSVRNYISLLYDKLGTKNRFEAMRFAIENHIETLI